MRDNANGSQTEVLLVGLSWEPSLGKWSSCRTKKIQRKGWWTYGAARRLARRHRKTGLTDHHAMDGRCKEAKKGGRAREGGREGGGEDEAGTNCRAKKVMKIAAQAGGLTGFKYRNDFIRGSISQRTDHALSSARRGTILEDGKCQEEDRFH